jgi:molecular chaperone GrpE
MAAKQVKKQPKLEDLQAQIAELTEALQRERADSENIRRRHEEQVGTLKTLVKANVIRELMPVIDNFERALKHAPLWENGEQTDSKVSNKESNAWYKWAEGVQNIVKQFEDTLKRMGVERIKTVGEVFDPKYHEAVAMDDGKGTIEVVCEELQSGYSLGDHIIRHAMVKVTNQAKKGAR